jgi:hypothetical protein
MKDQKRPDARIVKKQEGLLQSVSFDRLPRLDAHLFQNCGTRMMPGIITKAGKVIRLNVPKTSKKAKTKLEESEAFCDCELESDW